MSCKAFYHLKTSLYPHKPHSKYQALTPLFKRDSQVRSTPRLQASRRRNSLNLKYSPIISGHEELEKKELLGPNESLSQLKQEEWSPHNREDELSPKKVWTFLYLAHHPLQRKNLKLKFSWALQEGQQAAHRGPKEW